MRISKKMYSILIPVLAVALVAGLVVGLQAQIWQRESSAQVVAKGLVKSNIPDESLPITIIGGSVIDGFYANVSNQADTPQIYELQIDVTPWIGSQGEVTVSSGLPLIQTVQPGAWANFTVSISASEDAKGQFYILWTMFQATA